MSLQSRTIFRDSLEGRLDILRDSQRKRRTLVGADYLKLVRARERRQNRRGFFTLLIICALLGATLITRPYLEKKIVTVNWSSVR